MSAPTCYVRASHESFWHPAEVVKESASTITVCRVGNAYPVTFNKRKRYGESVWEDPRTMRSSSEWSCESLRERGHDYHGAHLTFEADKARKENESARKDRVRTVCRKLRADLNEHAPKLEAAKVPASVADAFAALCAALDKEAQS